MTILTLTVAPSGISLFRVNCAWTVTKAPVASKTGKGETETRSMVPVLGLPSGKVYWWTKATWKVYSKENGTHFVQPNHNCWKRVEGLRPL